MTISGLTWSGPAIDDPEIAGRLPRGLATLLEGRNGFILHSGALHVRGASKEPSWHSLRHVCEGESALADLYSDVLPTDIPFAEDTLVVTRKVSMTKALELQFPTYTQSGGFRFIGAIGTIPVKEGLPDQSVAMDFRQLGIQLVMVSLIGGVCFLASSRKGAS